MQHIDEGLEAAQAIFVPDSIRSIEGSAWQQIYESYQHGWIDTIEEAEAKFAEWRRVYVLGQTGLKHVW